MSRFSDLAPYLVGCAAAVVAALTAAPMRFGAHPWWADQVVWIGLPIGLAAGFVLSRLARGVLIALLLAIVSVGVAHMGKLQFAASYAEDQLAGQAWYFGWIATCAAITAIIVTVLARFLPRGSRT